jgi:hypothetical protein
VWSADQHDKWRRFGLFLHVGLENFSNTVLWLKVWWTNSNPRLIASFYLEAACRLGGACQPGVQNESNLHLGIPLITQSDPGTENNGIANAQTTLRCHMDPTLAGTLQHQWRRGHSNIKPEIFWSKLRRQWSEGWEELFEEGLHAGWYDTSQRLDVYVQALSLVLKLIILQTTFSMACNTYAPSRSRSLCLHSQQQQAQGRSQEKDAV